MAGSRHRSPPKPSILRRGASAGSVRFGGARRLRGLGGSCQCRYRKPEYRLQHRQGYLHGLHLVHTKGEHGKHRRMEGLSMAWKG